MTEYDGPVVPDQADDEQFPRRAPAAPWERGPRRLSPDPSMPPSGANGVVPNGAPPHRLPNEARPDPADPR
ncbi:hypothetical protein FHY52_36795, partial [Nocardia nova]|nr:hypothetical protein [Nocardia nova]